MRVRFERKPVHLLLTNWFLDPIVGALGTVIVWLVGFVHSPALALVILALGIRLAFWYLNVKQFKSMIGMQKIAPKIKALQAKFKSDPQQLQKETMALYQSAGVNPLAGCWPTLLQLPVLISVYYAVTTHQALFANTPFLWIGSSLSTAYPKFFGANLGHSDLLLVAIYMVTQYLSMRFTMMPPTDEAQAQQMKIMQIISPLMFGFIGFRANWPSAMVLYWLSFNIFTMAQQLYMLKRYHQPLSLIDSEHAVTEGLPEPVKGSAKAPRNGVTAKAKKGKPA